MSISILIAVLIVIIISGLKWFHSYWSRHNLQSLPPNFFFGNLANYLRGKEHISLSLKRNYELMKKNGWKHGGIYNFTKPVYLPIDLELVKNVLTRDFHYFHDRNTYYNKNDHLQAHLMNLEGKTWRNLRAKLTPTFTSGKMKMMFNIMVECEADLLKRMALECTKTEGVNIKEVVACFTTNIIGSCVFGLECKALEDENSEFRNLGKLLFTTTTWRSLKRKFAFTFPEIAEALGVTLSCKEVVDLITGVVQAIIDYREKNNFVRNDFMQMMISLKNKEPKDEALSFDEVASQCLVFFAAGFETSSTLMTFTLYELAKHQDIQEKVREEIRAVLAKHHNQLTYDSIQEMTYLNQVLDETLRIHPPAAFTSRKCVKDYQVPNTNVVIEKNTTVFISILGIHFDEEYYSNPKKFDTDRFTEDNKKSRHSYAHLPFGEGPRNCIGMRFGLLQAKVGIVSLLRHYNFTVHAKTKEPLAYLARSFVLSVKGGVWLNAQKI